MRHTPKVNALVALNTEHDATMYRVQETWGVEVCITTAMGPFDGWHRWVDQSTLNYPTSQQMENYTRDLNMDSLWKETEK